MENKDIRKLMALGYDVHIECRGKGNKNEFTYEATATKNIEEYNQDSLLISSLLTVSVTGESMDKVSSLIYERAMERLSGMDPLIFGE